MTHQLNKKKKVMPLWPECQPGDLCPNQTCDPHTQDNVGLTSAEVRSALHGHDDSKHMELIK